MVAFGNCSLNQISKPRAKKITIKKNVLFIKVLQLKQRQSYLDEMVYV